MGWLFWTLIVIWASLILATFWAAHRPDPNGEDFIAEDIDRGGHVRVIGRDDGEE